jgi:hypothetical protein
MIEYATGLVSLSYATALGFLFLRTIDRKRTLSLLELSALSYGIGLGLIAWEMLILQMAGIRFTLPNILAPLTSFCVFSYIAFGRSKAVKNLAMKSEATPHQPWSPKPSVKSITEISFFCVIGIELTRVFFRALTKPMEAYDAVAIWGLKAKAIYLSQSLPISFLQDKDYRIFHPDYPLFAPLVESYVYTFLGHFNDFVSKLIFPFFFMASLVVFYSALRRIHLNRLESLVFTFFLSSIPHFTAHATNGYVDVVVAFYFSSGFLYMYLWILNDNFVFLITSAALTALAGLTKNEGVVLCLVNFVTLGVALFHRRHRYTDRTAWSYVVSYIVILCVVLCPWFLFRASLDLTNDVINKETILAGWKWENLKRIKPILYQYQAQFFGPKNWNIVWVLFFGTIITRPKRLMTGDFRYIMLPLTLVLSAYSTVYLIMPFDVEWHLRTSVSRLFLHFLPLIVFFLARSYLEERKTNPIPSP